MDDELKTAAYFGRVLPHPSPNIEEYAAMHQATHEPFTFPTPADPSPTSGGGGDPLTEVIRQGAKTLLAQAIEAEVAAWIEAHAHVTDGQGHRQVVRNGHAPPRSVVTAHHP